MAEAEPEATSEAPAPDGPDTTPSDQASETEQPKTFDESYVKTLRSENAKHRTENRRLAEQLEELRAKTMTDQEKAVADAVKQGRTEALAEVGVRLVEAEFRAAAAGRPLDVDALMGALDRRVFLDERGEPDRTLITEYLDRLAPVAQRPVDLGQGARNGAAAGADMNALLRRAAGR